MLRQVFSSIYFAEGIVRVGPSVLPKLEKFGRQSVMSIRAPTIAAINTNRPIGSLFGVAIFAPPARHSPKNYNTTKLNIVQIF